MVVEGNLLSSGLSQLQLSILSYQRTISQNGLIFHIIELIGTLTFVYINTTDVRCRFRLQKYIELSITYNSENVSSDVRTRSNKILVLELE